MRSHRMVGILLVLASVPTAAAQTIQLPSFSSFSVDTTVVVPDRGATSLAGGKGGGASVRSFNGIPRQRTVGRNQMASGAYVRAMVHDPQAADDQLLPADAAQAGKISSLPGTERTGLARAGLARATAPAGTMSIAEIERSKAEQAEAQQREALATFEKGQKAEAAGKPAVAAIYYRTAERQATGSLAQKIRAQLGALRVPTAQSKNVKTARAAN